MTEVDKDHWKQLAKDLASKYMNRGGKLKGDEPEYIGGTGLLNTIGIALQVEFSDPETWTKAEETDALNGNLCIFKGQSRAAIDVVANKIKEECPNQSELYYITVLPIEYYYEGKLYSLALFRFKCDDNSDWKFLDNLGRVYYSFDDWKNNNKLPYGEVLYPDEGILQMNESNKVSLNFGWTPEASITTQVLEKTDVAVAVVGFLGGLAAVFLTGGLALPLIVAGAAVYNSARTVDHLVDRYEHDESIDPIHNAAARTLFLGLAANVLSLSAMGAAFRVTQLAQEGMAISNGFKIGVDIIHGASFFANSMAVANSTMYMIDNWEHMSKLDVLMQLASMAFWAKGAYTYRSAETMITEAQNQVIKYYSKGLGEEHDIEFQNFRTKYNNDRLLVKSFFELHKVGVEPSVAAEVLAETQSAYGSGKITINAEEGTISCNGVRLPIKFASALNAHLYRDLIRAIGTLSAEQATSLNEIQAFYPTSFEFLDAIENGCNKLNMTTTELVQRLTNAYNKISKGDHESGQFSEERVSIVESTTGQPIDVTRAISVVQPMEYGGIEYNEEQLTRFIKVTNLFNEMVYPSSNSLTSTKAINSITVRMGAGLIFSNTKLQLFANNSKMLIVLEKDLLPLTSSDVSAFGAIEAKFNNNSELFEWLADTKDIAGAQYNAVSTLIELQKQCTSIDNGGVFMGMPLNLIANGLNGTGVIQLNEQMRVSIFALAEMNITRRNDFLGVIKNLQISPTGKILNYSPRQWARYQIEFTRQRALQWFRQYADARTNGHLIKYSTIRPNDLNRLVVAQNLLHDFKEPTKIVILDFVFKMEPKTVSEFVSYIEYSLQYAARELAQLPDTARNDYEREQKRIGAKVLRDSLWKDQLRFQIFSGGIDTTLNIVSPERFINLKNVFDELLHFVDEHQMCGIIQLPLPSYTSSALLETVSSLNEPIKFPSRIGAAYHIYKRPGANMAQFLDRANEIIIHSTKTRDYVTQEGNTRMLEYSNANGDAYVVVTDQNRVFLATYIENV